MNIDTERCPNCKKDIPLTNYEMHAIHCQRNIQLCPTCDEPIPRLQLETHKMENHSIFTCPECYRKFERSECDKHKKEECSKRIISCKYCDLELKADEILDHEDYCGSRTEPCDGCGNLIMLKSQQMHLDSNHKFNRDDEDFSSESDDDSFIVGSEENIRNNYSSKYGRNSAARNQSSSNSYSHQARVETSRRKPNPRFNPYALEEDFGNLDLEDMRRGRRSEVHRAVRNTSNTPASYAVEEETYLPCEFCDEPIVADDLVLHQTGCRPDLASYESSSFSERSRNRETVPVYDITDDEDDFERIERSEVFIPCEFCNEQLPFISIEAHQMSCRNNHLGSRLNREQRSVRD